MSYFLISGVCWVWKTTLLNHIKKYHLVIHQWQISWKSTSDLLTKNLFYWVRLLTRMKKTFFTDINPFTYQMLCKKGAWINTAPQVVFHLRVTNLVLNNRLNQRKNTYKESFFNNIFSKKYSNYFEKKILQYYSDNWIKVIFLNWNNTVEYNYHIICKTLNLC